MSISFVNEQIQGFIDFLNKNYDIGYTVTLCILPKNIKTNIKHWAFYESGSNLIIVQNNEALNKRKDKDAQIMGVIAHEYRHFMNEKLGRPQNEQECDYFAYRVVEEYFKLKGDGSDK